jgi:hypothetical protein
MVFGFSTASTSDPAVTQCAQTTQTAFGLGKRGASVSSVFVNAFSSIAFIGDPCPTNKTGILMATR